MTVAAKTIQRILVAADFSPAADSALKQAIWVARQSGATIVVAHTLPDLRRAVHSSSYPARMDLLYGEGEVFEREIRSQSDSTLRRMIAEAGAPDLDIRSETLLGRPFVEITHAVLQENYDLVIAGTRGHSNWERLLVGSTATRLIRKCPSAVWIVKAEHDGPPKVVLAPTDFSEVSRKAVAWGVEIARQAGAAFHLLHVVDSEDVPENLFDRRPAVVSYRDMIHAEASRRLADFIGSIDLDRKRLRAHISWGSPWREIDALARHLEADLIALGTVGRSGVPGIFLGNTAEKVLGACDCSILTVKPDGFVSPIPAATWRLHPETGKRSATLDAE